MPTFEFDDFDRYTPPPQKSQKLKEGLKREDVILDLFRQIRGLMIMPIPAREGARRGTRVHGQESGELQAHDFLGTFADVNFDIQVKSKQQATWRRVTESYEHGFDLPVYEEYLRLYEYSARRLWLVFYETGPQSEGPGLASRIRGQWWHRFKSPPRIDRRPREHAPKGMAYFQVEDMLSLFDTTVTPHQPIMVEGEMASQVELRQEFLIRPKPTIQRRLGW